MLQEGEIYVDGKFFGNTPSDITLAVGEHSVKVTLGRKECNTARKARQRLRGRS